MDIITETKQESKMTQFSFYHGRNLTLVDTFTDESFVSNSPSYTIGLNGSVSGFIEVETTGHESLISTLTENSHFIRFCNTDNSRVYGAVVSGARVNKNICHIDFVGAMEYLDKVDAIASHKAAIESGAASNDDKSWIKTFYSDSPVGVLFEVMRNNEATMTARGYNSSLFNYRPLRDVIESTSDQNWERSYRLNSMEAPTLKTIINDVLGDQGMQLFRIRVSPDFKQPFSFIFEVVKSSTLRSFNEATDPVFDIRREDTSTVRRAFSIAKGTDLIDRTVVERVGFNQSVAYSSSVVSSPSERSASIRRLAESDIVSKSAGSGTLSFKSYSDSVDPLDFVTIGSDLMPSVSGVVIEKSVEGQVMEYKLQVGEFQKFNAAVQPSSGGLKRVIFNPLNSTSVLASQTAGRLQNSTGWRS